LDVGAADPVALMSATAATFRVDRFLVPTIAREPFLARVYAINALLQLQPGFVRSYLLERDVDAGVSTLMTFAEWRDQESMEGARAAMGRILASQGFNPAEFMTTLGITAEMGTFRPLAVRQGSPL
jgi:hypothetical protein